MLDLPQLDSMSQPAVMVVAAKPVASKQPDRQVFGICQIAEANQGRADRDPRLDLSPEIAAHTYLEKYHGVEQTWNPKETATSIIRPPAYGALKFVYSKDGEDEPDVLVRYRDASFKYVPTLNYEGDDFFIMQAQLDDKKVTIHYYVKVTPEVHAEGYLCKKGTYWKISLTTPSEFGPERLATWQRSTELSALLSSAGQALVGFSLLDAQALSQTQGEGAAARIILDQDVAGYGWYIDHAPLVNSDEYLPTADPSIWKAKIGSEAEVTMDLSSVLLHEYGHALGVEHSADARVIDVLAVPVQESIIALVAASESGNAPSFNYVFKACSETQPTPDDPGSAMRGVDPAAMLRNYYANRGQEVNIAKIQTKILLSTKHGELTPMVGSDGIVSYYHLPTPGFLGDDQAIFEASYRGARYKIILNIIVSQAIDEKEPICPQPQLIRVKKPTSARPVSSKDVIYTLIDNAPVISVAQRSAQTGAGARRSEGKVRTLNAGCADVEIAAPSSTENDFSPMHVVMRHLGHRIVANGTRYDIPRAMANNIQVTLSSPPSHGDLVPFTPNEHFYWKYVPKGPYKGRDSATFLVNVDGKKFGVMVHYAVQEIIWDNQEPDGCRLMFPGEIKARKFGSAAELLFAVEGSLDQWLAQASLSELLAAASVAQFRFASLHGAALGVTQHEQGLLNIVLDDDGAGHGWYIDSAPLSRADDYLSTAELTIWKAKLGSEATGQMDLLSVPRHCRCARATLRRTTPVGADMFGGRARSI